MIYNYLKKKDLDSRITAVSEYLFANNIDLNNIDILKITVNLINISYSHGGSFNKEELLEYLKLFIRDNSLAFLINEQKQYPAKEEITQYKHYLSLIEKELSSHNIVMSENSLAAFSFDVISQTLSRDERANPIEDGNIIYNANKEINNNNYQSYIFTYGKDIPYDKYLVRVDTSSNKIVYIGHVKIEANYNIYIKCISEQETEKIKKIFEVLKLKKLNISELIKQFEQILNKEKYAEINEYNGIMHEFLNEPNEFAEDEFLKSIIV